MCRGVLWFESDYMYPNFIIIKSCTGFGKKKSLVLYERLSDPKNCNIVFTEKLAKKEGKKKKRIVYWKNFRIFFVEKMTRIFLTHFHKFATIEITSHLTISDTKKREDWTHSFYARFL